MIKRRTGLLIGFVILAGIGHAFAQTTTTAPSTGPATTRRARWVMTLPPGFVLVAAQGRTAFCEPTDEAWVKSVLESTAPTTRPTTMPADLAQRLIDHRAALIKQMSADFGITDTAAIDELIDKKILPDLKALSDFHPPIFFMVCSVEKLKELVKGGWGSPKFYYNRAADDVAVQRAIALSTDNMDDYIVPIVYKPTDSPDARQNMLRDGVSDVEGGVLSRVAVQGQTILKQHLIHYLDEKVIAPLDLKTGREWLGIGLEALYAARYVAMVNDTPAANLIRFMTMDDPNNPIRSRTIDLLHLTPPAQLRPQYSGAYFDALSRKSTAVVDAWLAKAPPDATPKLLTAIAQQKPADGEALLKLIKETSGVDLSEEVKAK